MPSLGADGRYGDAMDRLDPLDMRAGDPDRERTAEVLRRAAGDGRIDLDELDDRLGRAYAAKTYRDLQAVVADLPDDPATRAPLAPVDRTETLELRAGISDVRRSGTWAVPARLRVWPSMGNVKLDFRRADCPHRLVEIDVNGGAGNLVLILPEGWAVDVDGLRTGWGAVKNRRSGTPGPDGVLVRVTGGMGMGSLVARDAYFYEK